MTKVCTVCKESKSLSEFFNYKASPDGKAYRCKACDTKARKAYEANRPDSVKVLRRNARMRYKYGIEPEDYNKMLEEQGGKCAICKGDPVGTHPPYNSTLVVDHCHKTNKVRGLLCQKCNKALGLLNDSVEALKIAINYLSKEDYV